MSIKNQVEFDSVLNGDDYLQMLIDRMHQEKSSLVKTMASITTRIIQITSDDGDKVSPQVVLASLTRGLEMDLCMGGMDEINPNWKESVLEELANDPAAMNQLLEEVTGKISPEVLDQVKEEIAKVNDGKVRYSEVRGKNTLH